MSSELTIAAALQDAEDEIVERIGEFEFTLRELRAAFNQVANAANWKLSISAVVTLASMRERMCMHMAVRFFTGSGATLEHLPNNQFRVKAAGYYAAVGA